MQREDGGFQVTTGTKEEAEKLIAKLSRIYRDLDWEPDVTPTEEMDTMQIGSKTLLGDTVIKLMGVGWGVWMLQHGSRRPWEFIVHVAVHNEHPLHKIVEEINSFAWRQSSRKFKEEFPD